MKLFRRWQYWRQAQDREAALREEMAAHLEALRQELEAAGLTPTEARAEAQRRFGGMAYHAEESRSLWIAPWWADLGSDLRYTWRTLRRAPGLAATAIVSAAFGIGVCTLIFSVGNGLLSQPLRVHEPERLLSVSGRYLQTGSIGNSLSWPECRTVNESIRSVTGVSAYIPGVQGVFAGHGEPVRYWGSIVSANYFSVVRPYFVLGGGFAPEDDQAGRPPAVVLSQALWQSRFGGDRHIAGRTVELNGRAVLVLGVTAAGFRGVDPALISDFWIPFSMLDEVKMLRREEMEDFDSRMLFAVSRLRPGYTAAQAAGQFDVVARRLRQDKGSVMAGRSYHLERAGQLFPAVRQTVEAIYYLLLATATLVLLIACANIANLLMARAVARQREIATRLALGAGRGRLLRQLVTESLVLSLAGGLLGLGLVALVVPFIAQLEAPMPLPLNLGSAIDRRVAIFAGALSLLTGLAFGLVPAWRTAQSSFHSAIKGDAPWLAGTCRWNLRDTLVVAQVTMAVTLLVGAGLALRSLSAATRLEPGLGARNLLMVAVDPGLRRYTPEREQQFYDDTTTRLAALPGVERVTTTSRLPLAVIGINIGVTDGRTKRREAKEVSASIYMVGSRFFDTLQVPVLWGEEFGPQHERAGEPVAIINQTAARRIFGQENPVGLTLAGMQVPHRVIGVTADFMSATLGEPPTGAVFVPRRASDHRSPALFGTYFVIRTNGEPWPYLTRVREEIRKFDGGMAILDAKTWSRQREQALMVPRLSAAIVSFCGTMGFLLAAIGLYGVIHFSVQRRARELGIRLALGARPEDVVLLVLRQGAWLTVTGLVLGAALSVVVGKSVQAMLYGVTGLDAVTYALVVPGVALVALLASWLPARRAARVDPIVTLRCE